MIKVAFYFWLCRVFAAARGLSLVVGRKGHLWLQRAGFSLCGLLSLQSTGSAAVTYRLARPEVCGDSSDQGLDLCPLHCKLSSRGTPVFFLSLLKYSCTYLVVPVLSCGTLVFFLVVVCGI